MTTSSDHSTSTPLNSDTDSYAVVEKKNVRPTLGIVRTRNANVSGSDARQPNSGDVASQFVQLKQGADYLSVVVEMGQLRRNRAHTALRNLLDDHNR